MPSKINSLVLDQKSKDIRKIIIEIMEKCGRAHPASAFSIIEILRVLYDDILKYDPKNPKSKDRDRFILSKGHGCLALYTILADKGFFPKEELWKFCKKGGILGGHPESIVPGVEVSTGSLGHGLSIGCGFAVNGKYEQANYKIFVLVGDGECSEGSIWEAALFAAKYKLDNLTVIVDYNKHMTYGTTEEVVKLEPFADKWRSFGFNVNEVDGHNIDDIKKIFSQVPFEQDKPSCVICHTIKGKGVKTMENKVEWHHKSKISAEEVKPLYDELNA